MPADEGFRVACKAIGLQAVLPPGSGDSSRVACPKVVELMIKRQMSSRLAAAIGVRLARDVIDDLSRTSPGRRLSVYEARYVPALRHPATEEGRN